MRRTAAAMLEGQDRLIGIYFATPRFFLVPYGRKRNAYMNDIVERSAAIDYLRYMMSDLPSYCVDVIASTGNFR